MAKEPLKNPQEIIEEYVKECLATLRLMSMEELILVLFSMNLKIQLFTEVELLRAFLNSIEKGTVETTAILSVWIEKYRKLLLEDSKMDAENIDEGLKFYRQDFNSAVSVAKK